MNGVLDESELISRMSTESCPFLGTRDDVSIRFGYPSRGNYCRKPASPVAISLSQQEILCLSRAFRTCQEFRNDGGGTLRQPVRKESGSNNQRNRGSQILATIGRIFIISLLIATLIAVGLVLLRFT